MHTLYDAREERLNKERSMTTTSMQEQANKLEKDWPAPAIPKGIDRSEQLAREQNAFVPPHRNSPGQKERERQQAKVHKDIQKNPPPGPLPKQQALIPRPTPKPSLFKRLFSSSKPKPTAKPPTAKPMNDRDKAKDIADRLIIDADNLSIEQFTSRFQNAKKQLQTVLATRNNMLTELNSQIGAVEAQIAAIDAAEAELNNRTRNPVTR